MDLYKTIEPFTWLEGRWEGRGNGSFPTIEPFIFEDVMHFELHKDVFEIEPLIHFSEKAWITPTAERAFKHWETGFIKPLDQQCIQWYVSHNTGRMEFTVGHITDIDRSNQTFKAEFKSTFVHNDMRTAQTTASKRTLELHTNKLIYNLHMSTAKVSEPTFHINVTLFKVR